MLFIAYILSSDPNWIPAVAALGGLPRAPQKSKLHTARLVVGTVGRVHDFATRDSPPELDLSSYGFYVLDEADRMLDSWGGFGKLGLCSVPFRFRVR